MKYSFPVSGVTEQLQSADSMNVGVCLLETISALTFPSAVFTVSLMTWSLQPTAEASNDIDIMIASTEE